jgi:signal transduction histidine kinase
MFKNLSTSTKLFILCGMFIAALCVTTYSLIVEKQIAIEFAGKELVGTEYLATIREVYRAVLPGLAADGSDGREDPKAILETLAAAETRSGGRLETAELQRALSARLSALWSGSAVSDREALDALAAAQALAVRVGDDSNLTLDPELDTYYLQDIAVSNMPPLLGFLGELAALAARQEPAGDGSSEGETRRRVVHGLIEATLAGIADDLSGAYRGNDDGKLMGAVESPFAGMTAAVESYLQSQIAPATVTVGAIGSAGEAAYLDAVDGVSAAWGAVLSELDRLLDRRIEGLRDRMNRSLLLTGIFGILSILVAILTHRHIVRPLQRFETVAKTVSATGDYSLRVEEDSRDEIGRLAASFNDMLAELAAVREREMSQQSELAQVTRLTTMGAMTASIAHEINQPLAAIVTNSSAALRWLGHAEPNLDEARSALKRIVSDGHRASKVIGSVRAMFKKEGEQRGIIMVNELVAEVLPLAHVNLQRAGALVETVLDVGIPPVWGDRVQLQQVLLNLIVNGAEAMIAVEDRPRVLLIKSSRWDDPYGALISVADSGTGIETGSEERIFEAFFTTKSSGMGMGLFICRSIVEGHGGRLWATSGDPHGSVFFLSLPVAAEGDE